MDYLSIVMGSVELSVLILLALIGIVSVVIRKVYLKVYPLGSDTNTLTEVIAYWRIGNILLLGIILALVLLKGFAIGYQLKLQSKAEEELAKLPPIVKTELPVNKQENQQVMNKDIFSLCLDKARTKEGIGVEAIKACTEASLFKVQDEK